MLVIMIKYKCGADDLLFITPSPFRTLKSTRKIHVQLPRLQMLSAKKLELSGKTLKKKTSFIPISLTPPKVHRVPSPSLVPRKSSPVSNTSLRNKSYFEHSFS